jgi:hypothetical protein
MRHVDFSKRPPGVMSGVPAYGGNLEEVKESSAG